MSKCKSCTHWKNEQSLLEYDKMSGFCTSPRLHFTTDLGRSATVYDSENPSDKYRHVQGFECIYERKPQESRYVLVTDMNFGCIYHTEKEKEKSNEKAT